MNKSRIRKWYRRHFTSVDFVVSCIVTIILAYMIQTLSIGPFSGFDSQLAFATVVTVEAEFASILVAALAIIAGFVPRKELNIVRETEHFSDLWTVYVRTILYFGIGIIIGAVGLFFGPLDWVVFITVVSCLFLAAQLWRCVNILGTVISLINKKLSGN